MVISRDTSDLPNFVGAASAAQPGERFVAVPGNGLLLTAYFGSRLRSQA
jgi:hypothetical protein